MMVERATFKRYRVTNIAKDGRRVARAGYIFPGDGKTYVVSVPNYKLAELMAVRLLRVEEAHEDDETDRNGKLIKAGDGSPLPEDPESSSDDADDDRDDDHEDDEDDASEDDSDGQTADADDLSCRQCDAGPFKTAAGLASHVRSKHG